MSSNIKISGSSLDRRAVVHGGVTDFDDDLSTQTLRRSPPPRSTPCWPAERRDLDASAEGEEGDITFARRSATPTGRAR